MNPTENGENALAQRGFVLSNEVLRGPRALGREPQPRAHNPGRSGVVTVWGLARVVPLPLQRLRPLDARGWQKRVAVGGRAIPVAFLAALTLAACTTPQSPTITYQPVSKIVVASCIPKSVPQAPIIHTDGELRTMEPASRYLAIAADRAALFAWRWTVGPVIEDCRQAGE